MNIALVLAGGTGNRVGADVPKQYIEVADKPVISYCMETLTAHDGIDAVQIVADVMWQEYIRKHIAAAFPARGRTVRCRSYMDFRTSETMQVQTTGCLFMTRQGRFFPHARYLTAWLRQQGMMESFLFFR